MMNCCTVELRGIISIPETERNRVFERFYRQGGTGSGLGLSIVGEICRAHRAQISLEQGELGGLLVRVRFPDAPNAKPAT